MSLIYQPTNYADPQSCKECASVEHRSHRHSEYDFRIASTTRAGLFHRVTFTFRDTAFHCSCEWGQHRERELRRNRNALIQECIHVDNARRMLRENMWEWPSISDLARRASRITRPLIESEDDFELFDGDEMVATPAPAPVGSKEYYDSFADLIDEDPWAAKPAADRASQHAA